MASTSRPYLSHRTMRASRSLNGLVVRYVSFMVGLFVIIAWRWFAGLNFLEWVAFCHDKLFSFEVALRVR